MGVSFVPVLEREGLATEVEQVRGERERSICRHWFPQNINDRFASHVLKPTQLVVPLSVWLGSRHQCMRCPKPRKICTLIQEVLIASAKFRGSCSGNTSLFICPPPQVFSGGPCLKCFPASHPSHAWLFRASPL